MTTSSPIACPTCGLVEPVQKASVVYEGNTKEWQETSGSGNRRHTVTRQAKTLLGQRLSPPVKPNAGINPKYIWWGGCGLLLFIFFTFIAPFCAVLLFTVPLALLPLLGFLPSGAALSDVNIPQGVWLVGAACVGAVGLVTVLVVWRGGVWLKSKYDASLQRYQQKQADTAVEITRWERAMESWNHLYYCTRDDVVFVPGHRAAPAADMLAYLNERT